ncbi:homeodomain-like protein [Tanacetum coccineum]
MCTYLKNMAGWKPKDLKNKSFANIQELFNIAMKRVNTFVGMDTELVKGSEIRAEGSETREESILKRAGDELEQEKANKQKVDEDKETTELKSLMEVIPDEEEVAVDVIPLATKPPSIVDRKILKEGKISYYQIIRADGSSKRANFLKELRTNTFNGSDHEDANEHIEKVLKIVYLFHIPNITIDQVMLRAFRMSLTEAILDSRGAIPFKTAADAKVAIQEMAEYSQKWHNGTSRLRSTKTSDGLAAIQVQLNNLGREIKKVNEKVYATQVGCEQCKGTHYTKDCPLKEEEKTLKEAYT